MVSRYTLYRRRIKRQYGVLPKTLHKYKKAAYDHALKTFADAGIKACPERIWTNLEYKFCDELKDIIAEKSAVQIAYLNVLPPIYPPPDEPKQFPVHLLGR